MIDLYLEHFKKIVDTSEISETVKFCIDGGNGVLGSIIEDLSKTYNLNYEGLFMDVDGNFPNHPADPSDENIVYVLNAPMMKSIDGGKTFTNIPVPHGDNHYLWINPDNSDIMINSNDGGANISFNGGKSWSTQKNQPTSQFYRVNVDNRFPYWVYA